ncbi:MAG TPA: hypothetical protein VM674_01875 [Candidatus Acidoferrum sp.]|nr:hypothetical protein [Candidatus Acidoferrum sp.]
MTNTELRVNRRQALLGAGIVGAGALAALMPAVADATGGESRGLEGAWLIQVTPDPGTVAPLPHQVLALYTKGGGVVITSSNPPNGGSPGLGAWERIGDHQYREIFETFQFDAAGTMVGLLQIRTETTVDEAGDHQVGRAHIFFQPAGSSSFFPAGTTHYSGRRIEVLPL